MLESEFTRGRCEPGETGSFPPLDAETFGFGLALAQSLPGPLFNLSAFLGAAVAGVGGGIVGSGVGVQPANVYAECQCFRTCPKRRRR